MRDEDRRMGGPPWHVIDARRSVDEIHAEIVAIAQSTMTHVASLPIVSLWTDSGSASDNSSASIGMLT